MWLRDFLPEDLRNVCDGNAPCFARVITFGYNVSVYSKAASQRSSTFAEDLLSALHDSRPGSSVSIPLSSLQFTLLLGLTNSQNRRPIIFVGHSLGGIVIKKVESSARFFTTSELHVDVVSS
jgi:hypothetical protein